MGTKGLTVLSKAYFLLAGLTFLSLPIMTFLLAFPIIRFLKPNPDHSQSIGIFMFGIFAIMAVGMLLGFALAIMQLKTWRLLANRQRWKFCITTAGLSCLFIPLGTMVGLYTISYLRRQEIRDIFNSATTTDANATRIIPMTAQGWNGFSKVMMGVSAILFVIGGGFAINTALFLRQSVPATGTIVRLIENHAEKGGVTYAPVFTFQDASGKTHEVTSSSSSNPPIGGVGSEIPVLYEQHHPQNARIDSFFSLWGGAAIGGGLGLFYLIIFWIVHRVTKQKMALAKAAQNISIIAGEEK